MPFRDWLPSPAAKTPAWLLRGSGGAWVAAVALLLDGLADSAKQAVKARFPSYAAPDALTAIGLERQAVRATAYVYEDDAAFGARLQRLWDDLAFLGTKTWLVTIFEVFGFGPFEVYDRGERYPEKRKHVWVWLPQGSHPWGPGPVVGDGSQVGGGLTVGTSMRVDQVRNLREVTAPWIPPNVSAYLLLQTIDGPIVGDGSEVGDGSVVGGETEALRLGKETLS